MSFKVVVADNFHYTDESENYELGTFTSLELAVEAAKRVVDEYLTSAYEPGMSASELYHSYVNFGEDPYVIAPGVEGVPFSAWTYAQERCDAMCQPQDGAAHNEASDA
jgi:hypothetical protein